jgi:hypothetical protein
MVNDILIKRARTAADVDILPDTYILGHRLVGNLLSNVMNLILNVKLAIPNCTRVLLNAASRCTSKLLEAGFVAQ